MPIDLYRLSEGWLELESDPGVFTLLLEDFGCRGIQVEEIYDLAKPIEGTVYGFIFLFKWIEERRSRWRSRSDQNNGGTGQAGDFIEDENVVNEIFFAHQVVPNSCATHALLSVLLNCPTVQLGSVLERLQRDTRQMSPENKGHAIGNSPELARAHNSHAAAIQEEYSTDKFSTASRPANHLTSTQRSIGMDAFHFVSYVPINGRLIELDGLKRFPIDHGSCGDGDDWTEKFRVVIKQRLEREAHTSEGQTHDIRYSLMAVVPDKRVNYMNKLRILKTNRHIVLEALQQLTRPTRLPTPLDYHNYSKYPDLTVQPQKEFVDRNEEQERVESKTKTTRSGKEPLVIAIEENSVRSDLQCPLTIQTSISPTPSSSSSTDTSSEIGSAFNSPNNTHSDVDERVNQMIVCKLMPKKCNDQEKGNELASPVNISSPANINTNLPGESETTQVEPESSPTKLRPPSTAFTAKDLLSLLKKLEVDIDICESNLNDELEKRRKYRVDDSRRTHNYDQFITTFLAMLAEQGHLAELIERDLGLANNSLPDIAAIDSPPSPPPHLFESIISSSNSVSEAKKKRNLRKHVRFGKKTRN